MITGAPSIGRRRAKTPISTAITTAAAARANSYFRLRRRCPITSDRRSSVSTLRRTRSASAVPCLRISSGFMTTPRRSSGGPEHLCLVADVFAPTTLKFP